MAGRIRPKMIVPIYPDKSRHNFWSFGTGAAQASGFIKNAYYNGLGRYVCQLARVTFKFRKDGVASKGLRDFIETDIVNFSRANPGIAIYLKPRLKPTPVMVCEYLNNTYHWFCLDKMSQKEVVEWLDYHVTRSGDPVKRYRKPHHTDWPSIQGVWTPFTNIPPHISVDGFPNSERSVRPEKYPTATEQLLKLQQEDDVDSSLILKHHPHGASGDPSDTSR